MRHLIAFLVGSSAVTSVEVMRGHSFKGGATFTLIVCIAVVIAYVVQVCRSFKETA